MTATAEKMVVLGASPNPEKYSFKAIKSLRKRGYDAIAVGVRSGTIEGVEIHVDKPHIEHVHTILLYIGPRFQQDYYNYILELKPKRIIFNPGTENHILEKLAKENQIETVYDCALVMLSTNSF